MGLGNPGREHARDRHNAGFMVADALREHWSLPRPSRRFGGVISEGQVGGRPPGTEGGAVPRVRVALLWPHTYMNDAGRSVGPARGALKVDLERVLVVHDEIDLAFGEVRVRTGGGLAGHNGLKSIARALGGPGFTRVRLGVGRPDSTDSGVVSAHVLGPFREDPEQVDALIERARAEVERLVLGRA